MSAIKKRIEIGDCTLILGDSVRVMDELGEFNGVIADPPYSSGGLHSTTRKGKTGDKYSINGLYTDFIGDNRDQMSFTFWQSRWISLTLEHCVSGSIICVFTDWRQIAVSSMALQVAGYVWRGVIPWDKTPACRPYRGGFPAQCEYVLWGTNGTLKQTGLFGDGLITCPVTAEKKHHIAGKPSLVYAPLMELMGDNLLDPFMGSGSSLIAATKLNKKITGVELCPTQFQIAVDRITEFHNQRDLIKEAIR